MVADCKWESQLLLFLCRTLLHCTVQQPCSRSQHRCGLLRIDGWHVYALVFVRTRLHVGPLQRNTIKLFVELPRTASIGGQPRCLESGQTAGWRAISYKR